MERMKTSRRPRKGEKLDTTPLIRAFKFSTKNKSLAAYKDRHAVLAQKFGVKFPFKIGAKLNGSRKGAITRRLNKVAEFLNPDNQFRFVPLTPSVLKKVSHQREISTAQRTTKGVFVPVPKSTRKTSTQVKFDKKTGKLSVRTGKFKSTFKKYRSTDIVSNPQLVLRDAEKRGAESVFVSIKGHRGGSLKYGYSLKAFMRYMNEELLPDIEEALDDPESYKERKGKPSVFKNWFAVEFVSHEWKRPSRGSKSKPKKK